MATPDQMIGLLNGAVVDGLESQRWRKLVKQPLSRVPTELASVKLYRQALVTCRDTGTSPSFVLQDMHVILNREYGRKGGQ